MPAVVVRDGESFESALKRFKIKKREYFEKPSVKRKKKMLAAKKRAIKKMRRTMDKGFY